MPFILIYIMAKLLLQIITLLFINSVLSNHHGLQFLSDEAVNKHHNSIKRLGFTPQDFYQLTEGLIQGMEIFNSTDPGNCTTEDLDPINSDVANIISILQNFTYDSHTVDEINEIVIISRDIIEKLQDVPQSCKFYAEQIISVILDVIEYVADPDYALLELPIHILNNLITLRDKFNNAEKAFNDGQFHDSGYGFGDFIYEAFLWDYNK
jgi:hypothetical protein